MGSVKKIFTNWKVLLLLIFLFFSYITINGGFIPQWGAEGVAIRSIAANSSAALAGMTNPGPEVRPVHRERIISFNSQDVDSVETYYRLERELKANQSVHVETNVKIYKLLVKKNAAGEVDLGMRVYPAPSSNIQKGLDLEGGTRVLLKPTVAASKDEIELTAASLRERLNVYGLSDVVVRPASDLAGDNYVLVEIAGVTETEVRELLAQQGKFEAKIANDTVFFGGKKDITYVCRSADCSGIDPNAGCVNTGQQGYNCRFMFAITLSPEAAQRQAELTTPLSVISDSSGTYLDKQLVLYLDDVQVDALNIGAELRGRATTDIQISGSGAGRTEQEAMTDALRNMKRLQTIIITGSLPVSLKVVKFDTVSASLGKEFLYNIFFVGLLALIAVSSVIAIRYRKWKIILPVMLTLLSELRS